MFRIETGVDKERLALLRSRLRAANAAASPVARALHGSPAEREVPLEVWALDEASGDLVAGLAAYTWARWLHVDLLWVADAHRGTGLGSRLLNAAEHEALRGRSCTDSRVSTWDFQAPGFYRKLGYGVVCEIPGYPAGLTEYTLTKRLA